MQPLRALRAEPEVCRAAVAGVAPLDSISGAHVVRRVWGPLSLGPSRLDALVCIPYRNPEDFHALPGCLRDMCMLGSFPLRSPPFLPLFAGHRFGLATVEPVSTSCLPSCQTS